MFSTDGLNVIGSGLKEMVAPGGFVDEYLLGRKLTDREKKQIKARVGALSNGGSFVGCGQKQGFNLIDLILTPAYAYETSCAIKQADGTQIVLGITTYQQCQDAIYAYLNDLTPADRAKVLRSAGFAVGSGSAGNAEEWVMNGWLLDAVEKLDGKPRGTSFQDYLSGVSEGASFVEKLGSERWAIWDDSSLSWTQKSAALEKTGLDIKTVIAMGVLGGVSGVKSQVLSDAEKARILREASNLPSGNRALSG